MTMHQEPVEINCPHCGNHIALNIQQPIRDITPEVSAAIEESMPKIRGNTLRWVADELERLIEAGNAPTAEDLLPMLRANADTMDPRLDDIERHAQGFEA